MQGMNDSDAKAVLELFISREKSRIGLSKSQTFNNAVVEMALRDNRVRDLLATFESQGGTSRDGTVHKVDRPQLITYLRGVKHSQGILVQAMRKSLSEIFPQRGSRDFDILYQATPFFHSKEKGENYFWPKFFNSLLSHIDSTIEEFNHEKIIKPLFYSMLRRIEMAKTLQDSYAATMSTKELPSVPFEHKAVFTYSDIHRLFNPNYVEQEEEEKKDIESVPDDFSLPEYVEEADELLREFSRKDISVTFLRDFLAQAAALDAPRGEESIASKIKQVVKTREELEKTEKEISKGGWGVKNLEKERHRLDELYTQQHLEIMWFAYGCLQALDAILLGEWKRMVGRLKASKAFYKIIINHPWRVTQSIRFFKRLIRQRLEELLRPAFLQLITGLQNEAAIKDFNDDCYTIKYHKSRLLFSVNLYVKKHQKLVQLIRTLLQVNPALEKDVLHCPSLVQPLAANLARYSRENPERLKAVAADKAFAATLVEVIRIDFPNKALLSKSGPLFDLVYDNQDNPNFFQYMRMVAALPARSKQHFLSSPALFRAVWSLAGGESMVKLKAILSNPDELGQLVQSMDELSKPQ
jgi:hypothetical protein